MATFDKCYNKNDYQKKEAKQWAEVVGLTEVDLVASVAWVAAGLEALAVI